MVGWLRKVLAGLGQARRASSGAGPAAYQALRSQALSVERTSPGLSAVPPDAPVWGLLMEMGFPNGAATLFVLADGTTSLYHSGGGGVIGGQAHETVRRANATLLAEANKLVARLSPTSAYPLPQAGSTVFYARTDSGILAGGGANEHLGGGRHELSSLFLAGDDVS